MPQPLLTNDAIIAGLFLIILYIIFYTSNLKITFWEKIYGIFPPLLFCYLAPSILNSTHIIDGNSSKLYPFSTNYLLPAALILLTSTANLRAISSLGSKALLTFLAGTFGIIIGGPIALWFVGSVSESFHQTALTNDYWKGLVTITGSWIGGSSSQLALKEVYGCSEEVFVVILVIDALVANTWTALLFFGAGISKKIDKWLQADTSSIEEVKATIARFKEEQDKPASLQDISLILAVGFGGTALAHFLSQLIYHYLFPSSSQFLWLVIIATTLGILLSFTRIRTLEKLGSTDFATLFIYFLILTIGMRLDLSAVGASFGLLFVTIIWMLIHISIMLIAARMLKAPFFFVAVGSQANIGGVATAPAVASAFHPSLATVGVLLAVLSHILGTYCGILAAWLMQWVG